MRTYSLEITIFGLLGCCMGMLLGGAIVRSVERDQAIKANVGRYTINKTTGATNFEYKYEPPTTTNVEAATKSN